VNLIRLFWEAGEDSMNLIHLSFVAAAGARPDAVPEKKIAGFRTGSGQTGQTGWPFCENPVCPDSVRRPVRYSELPYFSLVKFSATRRGQFRAARAVPRPSPLAQKI